MRHSRASRREPIALDRSFAILAVISEPLAIEKPKVLADDQHSGAAGTEVNKVAWFEIVGSRFVGHWFASRLGAESVRFVTEDIITTLLPMAIAVFKNFTISFGYSKVYNA